MPCHDAPQLPDEKWLPAHKSEQRGISPLPSDNAYWLERFNLSPEDWAFVDAIWHIDAHGDKAPLLKLLRNTDKQRATGKRRDRDYYLADLLERYDLQRSRNRQRTPAYDLTHRERVIAAACDRIRDRAEGVTVGAAIDEQARLCKDYGVTITPVALRTVYKARQTLRWLGKRGAQKKKPPPKRGRLRSS